MENEGIGQQTGTTTTAGNGVGGDDVPELTARMVNEFVYCPRLFYYEFVEGVFAHNADTLRGAHGHRRVDAGSGKLESAGGGKSQNPDSNPRNPEGGATDPTGGVGDDPAESGAEAVALAAARERGEVIHSRSVWLGSARWGVNAKLDLVETRGAATVGGRRVAVPVDYKKGSPREGEDGNTLWDADRIQLGLQMLLLREHGFECPEGVIYYQETRQRVRLSWTAELGAWIERTLGQARVCAVSLTIPPPLVDSPKCPRCSLAPICLPDETTLLAAAAAGVEEAGEAGSEGGDGLPDRAGTGRGGLPLDEHAAPPRPANRPAAVPVRRLMTPRDERRPLYLNTPGLWVGMKSERLIVKERDQELDAVRLSDVSHLALFGNIQLSTQAVQKLCEMEVPITYFSMGGWFYGLTRGHGLKNIFTRVAQFRRADDAAGALALAKRFVHGKIRNCRTLLMRNHIEVPDRPLLRLKQAARDVLGAGSREELLGMEGAAAATYFEHFAGMIKTEDRRAGAAPGLGAGEGEGEAFRFDFNGRNRRPPRDPVNALLSLAYSLLAKDCTIAALTVGFDPYLGFYHQPRHGRPALALDLMEEFRPLVAESAVITALNTRVLDPGDFLRAGEHGVNLTPAGRRRFFDVYEKRMAATLRHPVFDYPVSYRRALELQARLLARSLTGEVPEYPPLMTR